MEEQLISFETAKLAKDRGFNLKEPCTCGGFPNCICDAVRIDNYIYKPTQSLLQKWLREKHHLIITIAYQYEHDSTPYSYWIYKENNSLPINQWVNDLNTYEEALELGLQETLKLI